MRINFDLIEFLQMWKSDDLLLLYIVQKSLYVEKKKKKL